MPSDALCFGDDQYVIVAHTEYGEIPGFIGARYPQATYTYGGKAEQTHDYSWVCGVQERFGLTSNLGEFGTKYLRYFYNFVV